MRKIKDVIRRWLDRLVGWRDRPITVDQVETDDPMQAEAVMRAWNSKKMVIGNRDAQGKVTWSEYEIKPPNDRHQR